MKGKSPKLQSSWEGLYRAVNRENNMVYKIQQNPRTKMMIAHLDRLTPYQGTAQDEQPYGGNSCKVGGQQHAALSTKKES
jgi:hypothetical protein